MPVLFARIRVADFTAWKADFDLAEPLRREQGIVFRAMYQDAIYANGILLLFDTDDVERAWGYYHSDSQRQRMARSGLERPAEMWIGTDLNRAG